MCKNEMYFKWAFKQNWEMSGVTVTNIIKVLLDGLQMGSLAGTGLIWADGYGRWSDAPRKD